MTYEGTLNKILILFACILVSASATLFVSLKYPGFEAAMMFVGGIGGFILALGIMLFRPAKPGMLISIYALAEGMFIGGMTILMEVYYPGIAIQAGIGTIGVFGTMFILYRSRIIRPTKKFVIVVSSMMGAIFIIYIFSWVAALFGMMIPFIHSSGYVGILFSLFVIGVSALMLIIDFGVIESGVNSGASSEMEWWGAFGLTITLIWVYIEMIRLISKIRD